MPGTPMGLARSRQARNPGRLALRLDLGVPHAIALWDCALVGPVFLAGVTTVGAALPPAVDHFGGPHLEPPVVRIGCRLVSRATVGRLPIIPFSFRGPGRAPWNPATAVLDWTEDVKAGAASRWRSTRHRSHSHPCSGNYRAIRRSRVEGCGGPGPVTRYRPEPATAVAHRRRRPTTARPGGRPPSASASTSPGCAPGCRGANRGTPPCSAHSRFRRGSST